MGGFNRDKFVSQCLSAVRDGNGSGRPVRELLDRALSDPSSVEAEIGDPEVIPSMTTLHRSDEVTILHIVWPPEVDLFAHDHKMWAAIGVYRGREDAQYYRRVEGGRVEPHTGKTLRQGESTLLGADVVHSVSNTTREWTAAIHIYGGDYFTAERTMWRGDTLEPMPLDVDLISQRIEAAAEAARSTTT